MVSTLSQVLRAKRVQRYSRAPYELERFAARRRLSHYSHDLFPGGGAGGTPASGQDQAQSFRRTAPRARKGGAEGIVHRVEARLRPVELILDNGIARQP